MPISKEEFQEIQEKVRISNGLSPLIVDHILIPYVKNEFTQPKISAEKVKAIILKKLNDSKDASKAVHDTKDCYLIEIDILHELLKEINEEENDNRL